MVVISHKYKYLQTLTQEARSLSRGRKDHSKEKAQETLDETHTFLAAFNRKMQFIKVEESN